MAYSTIPISAHYTGTTLKGTLLGLIEVSRLYLPYGQICDQKITCSS